MNDEPKSFAPDDNRQVDADLAALQALAGARAHDVDAADAARLRAHALATFDRAHQGGMRGMLRVRFAYLWSRWGVPVVLAGVCGVYLTFALRATAALYH